MMYVEQYAQQRINEQQYDRESEWRRIAEHWNEDARTVRASRWAIVRLFDRMFGRRRSSVVAQVPDGARPRATDATNANAVEVGAATDVSPVATANPESIWPADSAAGRFAEGIVASDQGTEGTEERGRQELAVTR